MTRREARIACMQILYSADFTKTSLNEAKSTVIDGPVDPAVEAFLSLVEY